MKTKLKLYCASVMFLAAVLFVGTKPGVAQVLAPGESTITKQQKTEIEMIIRDYLIRNPSVILEVNQAILARQEEEKRKRQSILLAKFHDQLFLNPTSPVGGNSNGELTIIAFFDYNCGYCKQSLPYLKELAVNRSSLRIVYKELPILGEGSYLAAKAALAADRQGKYKEFHGALASFEGAVTNEAIEEIAGSLLMDYAKLKKDMDSPAIDSALQENSSLANALGIEGTPAYIIAGQIVPGAIDAATMERLLAEAPG